MPSASSTAKRVVLAGSVRRLASRAPGDRSNMSTASAGAAGAAAEAEVEVEAEVEAEAEAAGAAGAAGGALRFCSLPFRIFASKSRSAGCGVNSSGHESTIW